MKIDKPCKKNSKKTPIDVDPQVDDQGVDTQAKTTVTRPTGRKILDLVKTKGKK